MAKSKKSHTPPSKTAPKSAPKSAPKPAPKVAKAPKPAAGGSPIDTLFAEVERNPDDVQSHLVLADALAAAGDPRGELAHVQHALSTGGANRDALAKREAALVAEQREAILGKLAKRAEIELSFRLGLLDAATVGHPLSAADMGAALATVLKSPQARLLRAVAIRPSETSGTEPLDAEYVSNLGGEEAPIKAVLEHLVAKKVRVPPSVARLALGNAFERSRGYRCVDYFDAVAYSDDLSQVLTVFDGIEELRVDLGAVHLTWAPLVSERLKRFTLVSPFVRKSEITELTKSKLPALESFVLWKGQQGLVNTVDELYDGPDGLLSVDEMGGDTDEDWWEFDDVFKFLDRCPSLREVGIVNSASDVGELAKGMAKRAFAKKLQVLDLSYCELDADAGKAVAALLAKAPAIRELRLEGCNISSKVHAKVQRPNMTVVGQPVDDDVEYATRAAYRYVVTQE
jgi:hypothetical protein